MYLYVVAHQLLYEECEIQQGPFKGLQNGIESPTKFLEELSWAYRREHKPEEPTDPVQRQGYISEKHRILFAASLTAMAIGYIVDSLPLLKKIGRH